MLWIPQQCNHHASAEDDEYITCCVQEDGQCGPYLQYRKPIDNLYEIKELNNETKPHMVRLKLQHLHDKLFISEKTLIESRLGKVIQDGKQIRAHQYSWCTVEITFIMSASKT